MGIGWALVQNNNILNTFQAQTKFWPCSFKAEITAILSAIITAPRNCTVHVYTDSQSAISKYNSTNLTSLKLSFINTPYHSLWYTLINFINSYNIQLIFHKVTAHQDNEFNNLADNLARNHFNLPYLLFNPQNYYNPNYTLQLDNYPIELPIRHCICTICHAHIYALWSSQHRFQK
jgi:ribonuclease HI